MENCIFCKIVRKEEPSTVYYEDDNVVVIKNIHPVAPLHVLIIPKKHLEDFHDLKDDLIWISVKNALGKMIDENRLMGKGYKIVVNSGGAQIINHLHFHLMGEIGLKIKD